ncbi:MAG: putative prokaryotic signal transducing protein [Patescibacteria group bacterium]|nr:putative prokaryotic signal transducing protein [Patescibacteria group bacterium]
MPELIRGLLQSHGIESFIGIGGERIDGWLPNKLGTTTTSRDVFVNQEDADHAREILEARGN